MASLAFFTLVLAAAASPFLPTSTAARTSHDLLAASEAHVQLDGHIQPWATAKARVGPAPAHEVVHARLHIGYRNRRAVKTFADRVSYPSSPHHGKFITVQRFTARFAPPASYVKALTAWAASQALHVAYVAKNRKYVALEGTVAAFSAAIRAPFAVYRVGGMHLRATEREPSLPARLKGKYSLHFLGLDQGKYLAASRTRYRKGWKAAHLVAKSSVSSAPIGCTWSSPTAYKGDPVLGCGYTPQQIRSAYGIPANLTGQGQTVAIVDPFASPYIQKDLDRWSALFGLPSTTIQFEYPPFENNASANPPPGFEPDLALEEVLDVEIVHGLAPGARIVYLGAATFDDAGLDAAISYVIEEGLASVVSNSYGEPLYGNAGLTPDTAASVAVIGDLALQAAAVGIGIYASSGDNGDASTTDYVPDYYDDVTTPLFFAADPYVTAVGGTLLAIGAKGQYVREYAWGELECPTAAPQSPGCRFVFGGGGGVAYTFPTPNYQRLIGGPKRVLTATGHSQGRVVPDVAALADPYAGYIVGGTFSVNGAFELTVAGGTSLACPAIAAMVVLKQQLKGRSLGFANPYFYSNTGLFRDILPAPEFVIDSGSRQTTFAGYDTTLQAYKGYDNVTGIGTPGPAFWYHST